MQVKLLSSRYQIIEPLGQGGFGKTYLAEDILLPGNPKCVVKQFHPSFSDSNFLETARRLFNTEAETLQKLGNHPQIPQLLAHFEQEQEFYLVQQFIDGHTLSQELISDKHWSQTKVIEFLQDCLNILDFVHSNNVIHRDVKPDNIIRRRQDNKVVLVDFGTVKEVVLAQTQLVNSTVAVGTRGYMPTEQARGKPRITSDIYALGIIAIQALTGVNPMQLQEDENGEFIWQSQADINPQLVAIINKMVRYHFKDRHQSAQEVLQELSSIQFGQPSSNQNIEYTPTNILNLHDYSTVDEPNQETGITTQEKEFAEDANFREQAPFSQTDSSEINSSDRTKNKQVEETSRPETTISQDSLATKLVSFFKSDTGKIASIGLFIGVIATGGMYFLNYSSEKAQEQKSKDAIATLINLQSQKNYEECYEQSDSPEIKQAGISEAERLRIRGECGLSRAQEEASVNKFAEAINKASEIDDKLPNYQEVQKYKEQWSEAILKQATEIYQKEGNLEQAIATIAPIKSNSSAKEKSLDLKKQWEEDYQKNKPLLEASEGAINQENWQGAISKANELINNAKQSHSSYWEKQGLTLKDKAETELEKIAKGKNQVINSKQPQLSNSNSGQSQPSSFNSNSSNPPKIIQGENNQNKQDLKQPLEKKDINIVVPDEGTEPIDLCDSNNALMTGNSCP